MGFRKAMLTVAYEHKDVKDVLVIFADKQEKSMRDDLGLGRMLLLMDMDSEVRDELEIFSLGDGGIYIIVLAHLTYKDFYVRERALLRDGDEKPEKLPPEAYQEGEGWFEQHLGKRV